ncbi:MAG: glycosyltransferase family 9 protein [Candidatus Omnitrophica bacterium]|nr:glycosyltransferase family 9 protein [Candidatus Omnitrophota bacterium]
MSETIKKILVISLSNIGDVVLTLPVIDILKRDFPSADLDVVVGPKAYPLLEGNPYFRYVMVFDKHWTGPQTLKWIMGLRRDVYDLVVDLRCTAIPLLLACRRRTPVVFGRKFSGHMLDKHLARLRKVHPFSNGTPPRVALWISEEDQNFIAILLWGLLNAAEQYCVMAPGAASAEKQWPAKNFGFLAGRIYETTGVKTVFIGESTDKAVVDAACQSLKKATYVNLCGQTTLRQLAAVIQNAKFVVGNDSGPLHIASYFNIPLIGLFGPKSPDQYGPWGKDGAAIRRNENCRKCADAKLEEKHSCMEAIKVEDVFSFVGAPLVGAPTQNYVAGSNAYKNILIIRTDRIGDVVLTTPVFKILRENFPGAKITALLSAQTKDLVAGNPDIDAVMVDDRKNEHQGFFGFIKLIRQIRSRKFDLALVYHTKRRTNALGCLAGIPRRVGFRDRKWGFLLNDPVKDERYLGKKHETEYCLDILRHLGLQISEPETFVPIQSDGEEWAQAILRQKHLTPDRLIAIHPDASDPAKCWPIENFVKLIDGLARETGADFLIVGSGRASASAAYILERFGQKWPRILDLTGQTNLRQLTAVLKHCRMLVSNDSGPVHIADAIGTPVVSIFTRNQPGINPERWRPFHAYSSVISPAPDAHSDFKKAKNFIPADLNHVSVYSVLQVCQTRLA